MYYTITILRKENRIPITLRDIKSWDLQDVGNGVLLIQYSDGIIMCIMLDGLKSFKVEASK